jgi:hypothetical protein
MRRSVRGAVKAGHGTAILRLESLEPRLLLNGAPTASFTDVTVGSGYDRNPQGVMLNDMDDDGDLDLFDGMAGMLGSALYVNDGSGHFAFSQTIVSEADGPVGGVIWTATGTWTLSTRGRIPADRGSS